jgi:hypothetical protein
MHARAAGQSVHPARSHIAEFVEDDADQRSLFESRKKRLRQLFQARKFMIGLRVNCLGGFTQN